MAGAVAAWDVQPQDRYVWAAIDGALGVVGLGELHIRSRRWRQGEISYAVGTQHWGRGVATDIAIELARYGFHNLRLHRIAATADPRNHASIAVLRKIGMKYEGRLRQVIELRDGWRDSEMFSLLAGEQTTST